MGRRVTGWGQVRVEKQAAEGNDPLGSHGYACEGDESCVEVNTCDHSSMCPRLLFLPNTNYVFSQQ